MLGAARRGALGEGDGGLGPRERADLLHGRLSAGLDAGGFEVFINVPAPHGGQGPTSR